MKFISLVRDLVDRAISDTFENIYRSSSKFVENGNINLDGLMSDVQRKLTDPEGPIGWVERWLETEVQVVTGIDLFGEEFDAERGWSIYHKGNNSLLLIRVEDLSAVYSEAVSVFF